MRRDSRTRLPDDREGRIRGGLLSLRIVRLAAGSCFQDSGRFGFRKFGVPNGGTFDWESSLLANSLVGNDPDAIVLELPMMGGEFECDEATTVALAGARCAVSPAPSRGNGRIALDTGQRLVIGRAELGARNYLAVPGGFTCEKVLGSHSGRKPTDLLSFQSTVVEESAVLAEMPTTLDRKTLRFMRGPQAALFDVDRFCEIEFRVSYQSDRRGVRLEGGFGGVEIEIPSEPACFGAIQITPSGAPILIGPDGPTIGGYPKIGAVISADLGAMGQFAPGATIRFEEVSYEMAISLLLAQSARLQRLRSGLLARLKC